MKHRIRVAFAFALFVPLQAHAYTCPPLKLCFPKPVPILDLQRLGISTEAIAAAESTLDAWRAAQDLTRGLQTALGARGALSLTIPKDLSLTRALQAAAPAKLAGPSGDGFDVAQATLRATQARVETSLYTSRGDAPPTELAAIGARRDEAARAARSDALANALVRRAAMRTEPAEVADLRKARARARTLRDDIAINQRTRLLLARRFDEVTLLLTQYLELAAADRLTTQPATAIFPTVARTAAPTTLAGPTRTGALQERLGEALRSAQADTARRRSALAQDSALADGASRTIEAATRVSADVRQAFPDAAQAATPTLDQGLRALYADPATVKRALYDTATAGADAAPWSRFATAALTDPDAAAQAGDADLAQTWTTSVSASDAALATLADDPLRGGRLLVSADLAATALAQLRQGDALAELATWAQAKRLAAAHVEVRGWLDDAAQLAREAGDDSTRRSH